MSDLEREALIGLLAAGDLLRAEILALRGEPVSYRPTDVKAAVASWDENAALLAEFVA